MIEKWKKTRTMDEIDFIFCITLCIRTTNNVVKQRTTVEKTIQNNKTKFAAAVEKNLLYELVFVN